MIPVFVILIFLLIIGLICICGLLFLMMLRLAEFTEAEKHRYELLDGKLDEISLASTLHHEVYAR